MYYEKKYTQKIAVFNLSLAVSYGYTSQHIIFLFLFEWVVPEKIHTPTTDGNLWKFSQEGGGGSKTLEIQVGGGVEHEKIFCRGNFDW